MDKFDKRLKDARETYEPTDDFVERTMKEVKKRKIRHGFSLRDLRAWAPALAGGLAVLAIAIVFVPKPTYSNVIDSAKPPAHAGKVTQAAPTESPRSIDDGTDDASLERDLADVRDSMSQSADSQTGADTAVNDTQQQLSVPTN